LYLLGEEAIPKLRESHRNPTNTAKDKQRWSGKPGAESATTELTLVARFGRRPKNCHKHSEENSVRISLHHFESKN